MGAGRDLVREAFRTEEQGVDWRSGVAGAVACGGPLAIGIALDEPIAGLTAGVGALNTALAVPRTDLRSRLWWGSLTAVAGTAAVAVANIVSGRLWSVVAVTVIWVGAWAVCRAAGRSGRPPGLLHLGGVRDLGRPVGNRGDARGAGPLVRARCARRSRPHDRRS